MSFFSIKNLQEDCYCKLSSEPALTTVDDFNLDANRNDFIVILDTGILDTSTLLKVIAGESSGNHLVLSNGRFYPLIPKRTGHIYLDGKLINDLPPLERGISLYPRNYTPNPKKSGLDIIARDLVKQKLPKDEIKKRVEEVARFLGYYNTFSRKAKCFSPEQKFLVELGRCLATKPKLLLLDSPFEHMDYRRKWDCFDALIDLQKKRDLTIIYATNDKHEALAGDNKLIIMNGGKVAQADTAKNIYNHPVNFFTAYVSGSLNSFQGTVTKRSPGKYEFMCSDIDSVFPIPTDRFSDDCLDSLCGKNAAMGIRPENMFVEPELVKQYEPYKMKLELQHSRYEGDRIIYRFNWPNNFNVYAPPHVELRIGDTVEVTFNPDKIFLFDSETGMSL